MTIGDRKDPSPVPLPADAPVGRRFLAILIDVIVQSLLVCLAPFLFDRIVSNDWPRIPGRIVAVSAALWLLSPLLYSFCSIIACASPAQLLLGLEVSSLDGVRPTVVVRCIRVLLIKSLYLLPLAAILCSVFGGDGLCNTIAGCLMLIAVWIAISYFFTEQSIELGELPWYDRWLGTKVVRSWPKSDRHRGFEVVAKQR